jgi:hypothetical protein
MPLNVAGGTKPNDFERLTVILVVAIDNSMRIAASQRLKHPVPTLLARLRN